MLMIHIDNHFKIEWINNPPHYGRITYIINTSYFINYSRD